MKFLTVTCAVGLFATAALSGTSETPVSVEPVVAAETGTDWGGFYAGAWYSFDGGETYYPDNSEIFYFDLEGSSYGGFAGYNIDRGSLVYGIELATTLGTDLHEVTAPEWKFTSMTDIKGRLGYKMGNALPYITAGGTIVGFIGDWWPENTMTGYVFGAGVDFQINDRFFVGGEYAYRNVGNDDFYLIEGDGLEAEISSFVIRAGLRF